MRNLGQLMRVWHRWMGIFGVAMLTVFATTGLYLNHKEALNPIFGWGESAPKRERRASQSKLELTTANALTGAPISFAAALKIAQGKWGAVGIDKIELKNLRGSYVYRLDTLEPKRSLWISASSGAITREMGEGAAATDWPRFVQNLHHLNFGAWFWLTDAFALSLLGLNATGVWMWARHARPTRKAARLRRDS